MTFNSDSGQGCPPLLVHWSHSSLSTRLETDDDPGNYRGITVDVSLVQTLCNDTGSRTLRQGQLLGLRKVSAEPEVRTSRIPEARLVSERITAQQTSCSSYAPYCSKQHMPSVSLSFIAALWTSRRPLIWSLVMHYGMC